MFNTFLLVLHRIVYIIYKMVKKLKCGVIVPVPYKGLKCISVNFDLLHPTL
jgi:hypothetical protein